MTESGRCAARVRAAWPWYAAIVVIVGSGCGAPRPSILLATTSSADDTGLLDQLVVAYHRATPHHRVRPIVVGTGEALALARRGDVDMVLVHAVQEELRFIAQGHGSERRPVFANDFAIVGPIADPAGVAGGTDAAHALQRIAATDARFISRGDDSGTHYAELSLWHGGGGRPARWRGYVEVGLGMAETLRIAAERGAYTLTDLATFRVLADGLDLRILVAGDDALYNPYSVILVRDARNAAGAADFAAWLAGPAAQRIVAGHGVARYGTALFRPVATD